MGGGSELASRSGSRDEFLNTLIPNDGWIAAGIVTYRTRTQHDSLAACLFLILVLALVPILIQPSCQSHYPCRQIGLALLLLLPLPVPLPHHSPLLPLLLLLLPTPLWYLQLDL